jgi:hypothetical protein
VADWQPIETAPKSGGRVLLFFPASGPLMALIQVEAYPVSFPRQPTHWMPLPNPPKDGNVGA